MTSRIRMLMVAFSVVSVAAFLIPLQVSSIDLDKILGQPYYFHNDLSGVGSYRVANATFPTRIQNLTYARQAPVGIYEVGSGWIFPAVPRDYELTKYYNFYFSVWANSTATGNATLFWRFYYYRDSVENFLFTTKQSDILPYSNVSYVQMLWQHNIGNRTVQVRQGDRLVLRLFVNVTVAGTFSVGYDCARMPSFASDPTEIRFMRNAQNLNRQFPSVYTLVYGSNSSGSLSNLQASDDSYMVFSAQNVSNLYEVQVFFNGTHSGSMPFLQASVELKASIGVAGGFSALNYTNNGFDTSPSQMWSTFSVPTTDYRTYLFNLYDEYKYRSTSGAWSLNLTAGSASSFTLSVDFLYYETVGYQLGTAQSTTADFTSENVRASTVGTKVYATNATFHESLISTGMIANVTAPASTSEKNGTWNAVSSEARTLLIRIHRTAGLLTVGTSGLGDGDFAGGAIPLVFETEDLNATLSAVTWTISYDFDYISDGRITTLGFGSATYNTRINNFQWTIPSEITYLTFFGSATITYTPQSTTCYTVRWSSQAPINFQTKAGILYAIYWTSPITTIFDADMTPTYAWTINSNPSFTFDITQIVYGLPTPEGVNYSFVFAALAVALFIIIPVMAITLKRSR